MALNTPTLNRNDIGDPDSHHLRSTARARWDTARSPAMSGAG